MSLVVTTKRNFILYGGSSTTPPSLSKSRLLFLRRTTVSTSLRHGLLFPWKHSPTATQRHRYYTAWYSAISLLYPVFCYDSKHSIWDGSFYCPHSHNIHKVSTSKETSCFVLATSNAALEDNQEGQGIFRRIVNWIRHGYTVCRDAVLVSIRGSEIIVRFLPLLVLTPTSMVLSNYFHNPQFSDWTWIYVRSAVTALGPAFVKLSQWISTRRDIFPPHFCDRLAILQDSGIPHHWKYTDQALRQAFGEDYKQRGLQVDTIIGCGSAAQVYKGVLRIQSNRETDDSDSMVKDEVRSVAIKVLHPRLEELLNRDLWFVQTVASLLHSIPSEHIQMLNLPRAVSNFGSILHRQVDLNLEAANLTRFRDNFYHSLDNERDSKILFPRPIDGWISNQVLVEDLVDNATPIAEYLNDSTEEGHRLRKELASPLLRAFLKMVFIDNFIHCDLHSGNVLVQTSILDHPPKRMWEQWFPFLNTFTSDNTATHMTHRQIVFLDAGIATSLSPNDQRNLLDLFRAVILNEGERAGRLMVERARFERCSQIPGGVDAFANGIEELVSEFHDRRKEGLTLGAVRIGSLLSRVLDLCRIHGVEIDPAMASIVISTLVLEGLGRSLEPNLNLIDFAVPFVIGKGRV